jgi:hypothetical protein
MHTGLIVPSVSRGLLPAKARLIRCIRTSAVGINRVYFALTLIELAVKVLTYVLLANDREERDDQ